jgi:hypothetical protein
MRARPAPLHTFRLELMSVLFWKTGSSSESGPMEIATADKTSAAS